MKAHSIQQHFLTILLLLSITICGYILLSLWWQLRLSSAVTSKSAGQLVVLAKDLVGPQTVDQAKSDSALALLSTFVSEVQLIRGATPQAITLTMLLGVINLLLVGAGGLVLKSMQNTQQTMEKLAHASSRRAEAARNVLAHFLVKGPSSSEIVVCTVVACHCTTLWYFSPSTRSFWMAHDAIRRLKDSLVRAIKDEVLMDKVTIDSLLDRGYLSQKLIKTLAKSMPTDQYDPLLDLWNECVALLHNGHFAERYTECEESLMNDA